MIEIRDIPPSQVHGMARITLEGAKAFFADPENQKRFEAWQKERRAGRKETAGKGGQPHEEEPERGPHGGGPDTAADGGQAGDQ